MSQLDPPRDELSWERAVVSRLPLVREAVYRSARQAEESDELIPAGMVGLIQAIDRFDPAAGVPLPEFVRPSIEREVRREARRRALRGRRRGDVDAGPIRVARLRGLAAALGVQERDVGRALAAALAPDERGVERALAGEGPLESPAHGDPNGSDRPRGGTRSDRHLLAQRVRALATPERRILYMRFYLDMNAHQIARAVAITPEQVWELLDTALRRLRNEPVESEPAAGAINQSTVVTPASAERSRAVSPRPPAAFRLAVATTLSVVLLTGVVAVVLLVLALQRGI